MDRTAFNKLSFYYRMYEARTICYQKASLKVEMFRFDILGLAYSDSIIITPNHCYINCMILDWLMGEEMGLHEFLLELATSKEGEYTHYSDKTQYMSSSWLSDRHREKKLSGKSFSNIKGDTRYKLNKYDLDPQLYFLFVMAVDHNSRPVVSRYALMPSEDRWVKKMDHILAKDKGTLLVEEVRFPMHPREMGLNDTYEYNENMASILAEYQQAAYEYKGTRRKDDTLSLNSDYVSVFSQYLQEDLTYKKLKFWEMTRHNLFGEIVCQMMGWDKDGSFDIDVSSKYDYWGVNYNRTPDYVLEIGNMVYLLDFAVTNANAGWIADKKKIWYEGMRDGLEKHLKKEVRVEALVWKINSDWEFQVPPMFSNLTDMLRDSEVLKTLREMEMGFSLMKDYSKYKKMTDREAEDDENMDENLLDISNRLMKMMDDNMDLDKSLVCDTMESSRDDKPYYESVKTRFKDTTFYRKMDRFNRNFDEIDYTNKLVDTMESMVRENKMSKEMENTLTFDIDKLLNRGSEILKDQEALRKKFESNSNNKIPSLFKFPFMEFSRRKSKDMKFFNGVTPDFWSRDEVTEDGTYYYTTNLDFAEVSLEEQKMKESEYNVMGIGTNVEEDESMVNSFVEMMCETENDLDGSDMDLEDSQMDYADYPELSDRMMKVMKTRLWTFVTSLSNFMENLCYLEGRRHLFNQKRGHTVFKNFGEYMILIKSGSKLTSDKQIRFKVYMGKDKSKQFVRGVFKSMKESEVSPMLVESGWLAITLADIKHFLKVKEVTLAMFSSYADKMVEENRGTNRDFSMMSKSVVTMVMVMLEHRRGTSTSSQLNRYLLNSVTSFCTNRGKLLEDIFGDPTRSRMESFIKIKQMKWFLHNLKDCQNLWNSRILNMASTATDYDRFRMPSFYDLDEKVEFSILMDEIYTSNLFEKTSGFTSHRMKKIVDKMGVAEMHFHKVKMKRWSKGKVDNIEDFLLSKDELHMFDRRFVVAATRKFFNNSRNKLKIKNAILRALASTVDNAMMMTSSLEAGPINTPALKFSPTIEKDKTFLTISRMVKKLSTNNLMHMCKQLDIVDAIFSVFPKDQIGGAREILIQAILLRLQVKLFENINLELCRIHDKEMITKDRKRAEIQGDKMMEYKEVLKNMRKKKQASLYASMNSDASKWSPGFVMEHFAYSISNWGLDPNLESLMLSITSSFGNKKLLVPDLLKKKWDTKPKDEKEMASGVQFCRDMSDKLMGVIVMNSGMGQGMFHKGSSFKHCIEDDLADEVISRVLARVYNVDMHQTSLISSDDKTKMMIFVFRSGPNESEEAMKAYIKLLDWTSRLGNIHMNWKKSGLNFIITEFNSLFSVGRRMQWALVKDVYSANSTPDMTSPEEAVVFMNANIRRCFEHGMYLPTLKLITWMCRKQLMRYYKYDETVIRELTRILNCKEELLPYHLGFMPTNMVVEQILYGMEINMYERDKSEELEVFYWNLYSHKPGENYKVAKKMVPFSEDCMGKFWYELPMRLDKKLSSLRIDYYENELDMTTDQLMEDSNKSKLNHNAVQSDMRMYKVFTEEFFMGMKRKYEFQETMVVHSLIRALQVSTAGGRRYPLTEKEELITEEFREISRKYEKERKKTGTEVSHELMSEYYGKKASVMGISKDILSFTHEILHMGSKHSSIKMYDGLREVINMKEENDEALSKMAVSFKYTHTMMRTMRYYMSDIGTMAKKEEIIDFMFNKDTDFRSATVNSTLKLMSISGVANDVDIHENPFGLISLICAGAKYPNKVFSEFINLNNKSMKFMKITMLSDLPCEGNAKKNLLNWYRTKSNPEFFYTYRDNDYLREESSLEFLTRISLNKSLSNGIEEIPDNYYRISSADNILMKTMKLHSISNSEWVRSELIDTDRVDYRVFNKKDRGTIYRMWTNYSVLVKSEETTNNCYISINSITNMEVDHKNENIMVIIRRFIREMRESQKKIIFTTRDYRTTDNILNYNIKPIHWKTMVVKSMTYWRIKVIISAEMKNEDLIKNKIENLNRAEFNLYKDSYTVDSQSLMELTISDEYGEEIKVKEMYDEIPSLQTLDKIFLANNWIKEIPMETGEALTNQAKYSVQSLNESFGISSVNDTLSKLMGENSLWRTVKESKNEKAESNKGVDTLHVQNMSFEMPKMDRLGSVIKALKTVESDDDQMVIEFEPYERNSIVKNVDYLVKNSIGMSLVISKDVMKRYYNYVKKSDSSLGKFHNLLVWQIQKALDFEISNTMSLIIYNHIIKMSSSLLELRPSSNFVMLPKDFEVPESLIFVRPFQEYDEDWEIVMSKM